MSDEAISINFPSVKLLKDIIQIARSFISELKMIVEHQLYLTLSDLAVEVVLTEALLAILSFESDRLNPLAFEVLFLKSIYKDFILFRINANLLK